MGLFSIKKECSICGDGRGIRFHMEDNGWCCYKCFKKVGLTMMSPTISMNANTIKSVIAKKEEFLQELQSLTITKDFGGYIKFDENNRKWFVPDNQQNPSLVDMKIPVIYSFDDIISFELLENNNSITNSGVADQVVSVLFGGLRTRSTCMRLQIKITVNSTSSPAIYVDLITVETKTDSPAYKTAYSLAQNLLSFLQVICENSKTSHEPIPKNSETISSANEIIKYKSLLDQGIITQEEFEAKKKQLLGL